MSLPAQYHSAAELCCKLSDYQQGLICCGDKFITQSDELASISRHFPTALAVDMESAAIAQTCHIYNKPLLCLRQISDIPGHPFSEQQYSGFWKNAAKSTVELLPQLLKSLSL